MNFEYLFAVIKFLLLFKCSNALYEDQIKKFDWKESFVGKINYVAFDASSSNRLIVATEENVLAAISQRNGNILWRQILEKGARGKIQFFNLRKESQAVQHSKVVNRLHDIITVSGHAPALIRGWCSTTGIIQFEWSLLPVQSEKTASSVWLYDSDFLFHVVPVWGSHLEVTKYHSSTGHVEGTTGKISANWIKEPNCVFVGRHIACAEKSQLLAIDLIEDKPRIVTKNLVADFQGNIVALKTTQNVIIVENYLVVVDGDSKKLCAANTGSFLLKDDKRDIIFTPTLQNDVLQISAQVLETCEPLKSFDISLKYPKHFGGPSIGDVVCGEKTANGNVPCNLALLNSDESIVYIKNGRILWSREESLANVVAVEMIDLPLSDVEGSIENELNSKPGDIFGALQRRLSTQVSHLKYLLLRVLGINPPQTATQKAGLVRDAFGLHKMIVAVTKVGKLFGIDNLNGKHHWSLLVPKITAFNNDQPMKLVVQRTARHFPNQPLCTIIARHKDTENGVLLRFNPITGAYFDGGAIYLDYKIKQLTLLKESDTEFLKGLLILDQNNVPHAIPESCASSAHGLFMFTAEKQEAQLTGFVIESVEKKLIAKNNWKLHLSSHLLNHEIVRVVTKSPIEHVHSQGRVLSDRSVLYKYINPNLVAVVTQGLGNNVISVHLVDAVSGAIVFSMTHKKVKGPIHMVHSENWLVYSYYNDKVRRTEISSVELYEGKAQANSTIWSSLDSSPLPLVERQSYIFPAAIETLRETITEKGITNKHVLIGTAIGAIVEMPWALLDPRRPVSTPNQVREEGSIPYIPELPLPTENIINYNQSVARLNQIFTAPSGLESTCLVMACGLDIFVTRVSPSKTFDLLKEDFDYFLISVVLVSLIAGSVIVKQLSARKALKQAWK